MLVIGDIHGKLSGYLKLLNRYKGEPSVQLGDFGKGFPADETVPALPNSAYFLRGNHDNPQAARSHPNYLGDFGMKKIDGISVFFVSGAWSSDQQYRTEGVNWWRDEELCLVELQAAVDRYAALKPEIVLSHDAPDEAVLALLSDSLVHKQFTPTRTGQALNAMLAAHRPKLWIFGHWHTKFRQKVEGTEFRCLPELGWCRVRGEMSKVE